MILDLDSVKISDGILHIKCYPPLLIVVDHQIPRIRKLTHALLQVLGFMRPGEQPSTIDFAGNHKLTVTTWHDDIVIQVERPTGTKDSVHMTSADASKLTLTLVGLVETFDPH